VDSGTYTYPGPERNAFRGAGAHNAVLVDGQGSSEPAAGAFQWARVVHGRTLAWEVGNEFAYFEGTHDGFAHLPDAVAHRRAVLFLPGIGWVVRDRLDAVDEHVVRLHWHIAPGLVAVPDSAERGMLVVDADQRPVLIVAAFAAGTPLALRSEPAWVSTRYGARTPATRLVAERRASGAHDVVTFVLPVATEPRGVLARAQSAPEVVRRFPSASTSSSFAPPAAGS
jgi:hypothetical protein